MYIRKLQQRGDTMVEVLIAILIIGSVLVSGYLVTNGSFIAETQANERGQALQIMLDQYEVMRSSNLANDPAISDGAPFCIKPSGIPANPFKVQNITAGNECDFTSLGLPNPGNVFPIYKISLTRGAAPIPPFTFSGNTTWDQAGKGTERVSLEYRVYPSS